jgi:tetratricopeptide (TPR) repeat protein
LVGRLAVVAVLLALAHPVYADGQVDAATQAKADVFFEKGQQDYQSNRFQAAITLFQDAYELVHDPIYLFNIAQSYRKAADCQNASDYYHRYLSEAHEAPNASMVQTWLRELAPCVLQQKQRQLEAAKRAAEAARTNHEDSSSVSASVTGERDGGKSLRIGGLATGGAGAIALVVGIGYGIKSHDVQRELDLACATSCTYVHEGARRRRQPREHDRGRWLRRRRRRAARRRRPLRVGHVEGRARHDRARAGRRDGRRQLFVLATARGE